MKGKRGFAPLWQCAAISAGIFAAFAFGTHPLNAQTLYGSLIGNITDPSGAAVPGVKVSVVNTGTGLSRETASNERGGLPVY